MFYSMFKPGDVRDIGQSGIKNLFKPKFSTYLLERNQYQLPNITLWTSALVLELGGGSGGNAGSFIDSSTWGAVAWGGVGGRGQLVSSDVGRTSHGMNITLGTYGGDGAHVYHNMQFGPYPSGTTQSGRSGNQSWVGPPWSIVAYGGCGGIGVAFNGWSSGPTYSCNSGFTETSPRVNAYIKIKWM